MILFAMWLVREWVGMLNALLSSWVLYELNVKANK